MRVLTTITIAFALSFTPGLLLAQDVTGLWDIEASFTFPQETATVATTPDCEYEGFGIPLVQNGNSVTGTVDLNLTSSHNEACPGEIISGSLDATLDGSAFTGTLTGSKLLGDAAVSGSIAGAPRLASAAAAAATTMSGTASVSGGSFPGSAGAFSGQQLPPVSTMGPAAAAVLALVLFGGTVLLLTRRSRASV